jgi:dTDP-4-dehydrorhamnose reductase
MGRIVNGNFPISHIKTGKCSHISKKKAKMKLVKKMIIFGSQGMLGNELFWVFSERKKYEVIPLSRFNYNILQTEEIEQAFKDHSPDIVINAAAFTNVDEAELPENRDFVYKTNNSSPKKMAQCCKKRKCMFVHFSTDYVFSGKEGNYHEYSPTHPINVYGESKAKGEVSILDEYKDSTIVRTSRLFSEQSGNFVQWVYSQAKKGKDISAISDEIGHFTAAREVAKGIFTLLEKEEETSGIFHLFGRNAVSPADVAEEIVRLIASASSVKRVASEKLNRQAKRPKNCSLRTTRFPQLPGVFEILSSVLSKKKNI